MDIVKTGINVTKALRNIGRLREIVIILAKNGFDEFISLEITKRIPGFVLPKSDKKIKEELREKKQKDWHGILGKRLRRCFEELGPAFVKFGQFLSTREDIFEKSFTEEMAKLRDQVEPIPLEKVKGIIEKSLGKKTEEVFSSLEEHPLGTASIGVVYRGKLKNGDDIVVKVKRDKIDKIIETDFSIILFLATKMENVSDEIKYLGISRIVKDFSISIQQELNFHIERANCERFKKNLEKYNKKETIYVPKIYGEYSTKNILVMEFVEGIPLNKISKERETTKALFDVGLGIFLKTFLQDGFFHADLHGGNIILSGEKLGVIDYGLMGTLSRKSRQNLVVIVYALMNARYETLVHEFLDVAEYDGIPNVEKLVKDVRKAVSPIVGLSAQKIDYTLLLKSCVECLREHKIYLPGEWFVVLRSIIALDGLGRTLKYDVDVFRFMQRDIEEMILSSLSKEELMEESIWAIRDVLSLARTLPRHLKWFLRSWAKKGHTLGLRHEGLDGLVLVLSHALYFLGFAFLTGIFTLSGVLLLGEGEASGRFREIPPLCWVFWSLALLSFCHGLWVVGRKKTTM